MKENVKRVMVAVGIIILFCVVVAGLTVLIITATTDPAGANVKDERVSDCSLQEKKRECDGVTTTLPTTTTTTEVPETTTTLPDDCVEPDGTCDAPEHPWEEGEDLSEPDSELIPSLTIEREVAPTPTHHPAKIVFTG